MTVLVILSPLALVVCLPATVGGAPQQPATDSAVSLDRIREEVAKTPPTTLKLDLQLQTPVATFKTRVDQQVFVLSLEEWLDKEFKLVGLQRQSADWAAKCCGGYVLTSGSYGIRLDPLFQKLEQALERRKVRKIREQIARELAELEVARKKADLPDKR